MSLWDRVKQVIGADGKTSAENDPHEYQETGSFDTVEEGDRRVLAHMRAQGTDFSKSRHVRHFHFFPDETLATGAREEIVANGYEAQQYRSAKDPNTWVVLSERTGLVNESEVARERFLMQAMAEKFEGEYDGWEAALDK